MTLEKFRRNECPDGWARCWALTRAMHSPVRLVLADVGWQHSQLSSWILDGFQDRMVEIFLAFWEESCWVCVSEFPGGGDSSSWLTKAPKSSLLIGHCAPPLLSGACHWHSRGWLCSWSSCSGIGSFGSFQRMQTTTNSPKFLSASWKYEIFYLGNTSGATIKGKDLFL